MGCSIPIICDGCENAPYIGENGNWYVGRQDTGIRAQGPAGEQGNAGTQGPKGDPGAASDAGRTYGLLKPVTDYKVIFVEASARKIEGNYWINGDSAIAMPRLGNTIGEYGIFMYKNVAGDKLHIRWHFPSAEIISVDTVETLQGNYDNMRISKIYGIK